VRFSRLYTAQNSFSRPIGAEKENIMPTKITITLEEYETALAKARNEGFELGVRSLLKDTAKAKAPAAPKPAPITVTPELKARVLEAVKLDTVKDERGYYRSYAGHFIIGGALKKYGDKAEIKDATFLAAAKDYALINK
jgi:hypothetical protein